MWWDGNKTLTHNCLFNLVVGARGDGKTYWGKKRAVKNYKERGWHFVYLRRYQDELDDVKETLFNDIIVNNEFPDDVIEYKNDTYFINGEIFGYAMALTKAKNYKSLSYPLVYLIIFDEFLMEDNGYSRYLKNEVNQFLSLYMTIDRYRGCKVFFLGNNVTMINPYTIYWKLEIPYNTNIVKHKSGKILMEVIQDDEYVNERLQTDFGKIIEDTEFADYAIHNKSMLDRKDFIEKKSGNCSYYFTLKYMDNKYGIWHSYEQGKIWVSGDYDPSYKIIYSFTLDDHSENTYFIKNLNKAVLVKNFIDGFKSGIVYFESQKIKNVIYDVIKMCMR